MPIIPATDINRPQSSFFFVLVFETARNGSPSSVRPSQTRGLRSWIRPWRKRGMIILNSSKASMKLHNPQKAPCNNLAPGSSKDPHKDSVQTLVLNLDPMMPVCISLRLSSRVARIKSIPPTYPQYQSTFAFLTPRHLGYMGPPQHYAAPTYERPEPPTAVLPELRNWPNAPMPILSFPSTSHIP